MTEEFRPFSFRLSREQADELVRGAADRGESVSAFIRAAVEERLHPPRRSTATFQIGCPDGRIHVCVPPNFMPPTWTAGAPSTVEWFGGA